MTVSESTRIQLPHQEDSYTVRSDEPDSLSTITGGNAADCSWSTPSTQMSGELSARAFSIRRHPDYTGVPILMLLRYCSTIWISDLATAQFDTQSQHHSCVSTFLTIL